VLPDQLYLDLGGALNWIQPLFFTGNIIAHFEGAYTCDIGVDIAHGICIRLRFTKDQLVRRLPDGSFLYRCEMKAPPHLYRYTTGRARLADDAPQILLFHHTAQGTKRLIEESKHFRCSSWNIQGTKQFETIQYLYLTCLPDIRDVDDLQQIAMSHTGRIAFRLDRNLTDDPDLILQVYRDSTDNRTSTIAAWVNTAQLGTQPCYRHHPPDGFGYHEVVSPFIYRIGVDPQTLVQFGRNGLIPDSPKALMHAVVGNADSLEGLAAPFDEEDTPEQLRIPTINAPDEILSYWMEHCNRNLYDELEVEQMTFTN